MLLARRKLNFCMSWKQYNLTDQKEWEMPDIIVYGKTAH